MKFDYKKYPITSRSNWYMYDSILYIQLLKYGIEMNAISRNREQADLIRFWYSAGKSDYWRLISC